MGFDALKASLVAEIESLESQYDDIVDNSDDFEDDGDFDAALDDIERRIAAARKELRRHLLSRKARGGGVHCGGGMHACLIAVTVGMAIIASM